MSSVTDRASVVCMRLQLERSSVGDLHATSLINVVIIVFVHCRSLMANKRRFVILVILLLAAHECIYCYFAYIRIFNVHGVS